jgi:hypothetical protein
MLQTYYTAEYEFNSSNRLVPKKGKNKNAVLFEGGERDAITYQPLKIATDKVFFDQTQGQHPVLHLYLR